MCFSMNAITKIFLNLKNVTIYTSLTLSRTSQKKKKKMVSKKEAAIYLAEKQ